MRLQKFLNEIFKSTIEYEEKGNSATLKAYNFEYKDEKFVLDFSKFDVDEYGHEFLYILEDRMKKKFGDQTDLSSIGEFSFAIEKYGVKIFKITKKHKTDATKIFSFILNIFKDIVKKNNFEYIMFLSDKDEKSREKLYNRMIKFFKRDYIKIGDMEDFVIFILKV